VISDDTLRLVQEDLMDAMMTLYAADKDDPVAQDLAGIIIVAYESIELELLERMMK
jgi:hypothetical protein